MHLGGNTATVLDLGRCTVKLTMQNLLSSPPISHHTDKIVLGEEFST